MLGIGKPIARGAVALFSGESWKRFLGEGEDDTEEEKKRAVLGNWKVGSSRELAWSHRAAAKGRKA